MVLTGGLTLYLLAPLSSYWLFNDWRFWKYVHLFHPMLRTVYGQLGMILFDSEYNRFFSVNMTAPPATSPSLALVSVSPAWQSSHCECSGCSRCCRKVGCALLDEETGYCLSYDSFYWRYFNCGRYPATQDQIDFYDCPKWIMRDQPAAKEWNEQYAAASTAAD